MKEEIIAKILDAPLSAWTGHYTLKLNGVAIHLMRGNPGGSPCFWLEIGEVRINDQRLHSLYYSLYEYKEIIQEEEKCLTDIYNKLCKINK